MQASDKRMSERFGGRSSPPNKSQTLRTGKVLKSNSISIFDLGIPLSFEAKVRPIFVPEGALELRPWLHCL